MFLSVVHLLDRRCALCNAVLASAGSRSFIVDEMGDPVSFPADAPPERMQVEICCENGHANGLDIPGDASAEESLNTPDGAPIARDAVLIATGGTP